MTNRRLLNACRWALCAAGEALARWFWTAAYRTHLRLRCVMAAAETARLRNWQGREFAKARLRYRP